MTAVRMLEGDDARAWADARGYTQRLAAAGASVGAVLRPSLAARVGEALRASTDRGLTPIPIGRGTRGTRPVSGEVAFIDMRALPTSVDVDDRSRIARVGAGTTWLEVDEAAKRYGLTVRHLADAYSGSTVGGTLGARGVLPPLWRSATVRAECVGLRAVLRDGRSYRYLEAPRTASGPDLRGLFFDGEGRHGVITEASIVLGSRPEVRMVSGSLAVDRWPELRRIIDAYPGTTWVQAGSTADAMRVTVQGESVERELAREALRGLGFEDAPWTWPTPPERAAVVSLPWGLVPDALRSLRSKKVSVSVLGAVQTHVALAAVPSDRRAMTTATKWCDRVHAMMPALTRTSSIGALGSSDEVHPIARAVAGAELREDA